MVCSWLFLIMLQGLDIHYMTSFLCINRQINQSNKPAWRGCAWWHRVCHWHSCLLTVGKSVLPASGSCCFLHRECQEVREPCNRAVKCSLKLGTPMYTSSNYTPERRLHSGKRNLFMFKHPFTVWQCGDPSERCQAFRCVLL